MRSWFSFVLSTISCWCFSLYCALKIIYWIAIFIINFLLLCFRFYLLLILYIVFISYSICLVFTNSCSIWLVCLCVCWFFFFFFHMPSTCTFNNFSEYKIINFVIWWPYKKLVVCFKHHSKCKGNIGFTSRELFFLFILIKKKKKLFFCSLFFNFCNSGCILKISIMTCWQRMEFLSGAWLGKWQILIWR